MLTLYFYIAVADLDTFRVYKVDFGFVFQFL